jgi:hypothetical protein
MKNGELQTLFKALEADLEAMTSATVSVAENTSPPPTTTDKRNS